MSPSVLAAAVALFAGLFIGVQNPLASRIGERVSPLFAAFAVHLGGTVVAALALLLRGGLRLDALGAAAWLGLMAGGLGVGFLAAVTFAIPRIGVAGAVVLVVAGQLTAAVLLDHFGALGVPVRSADLARVLGLALVLGGAWLVIR